VKDADGGGFLGMDTEAHPALRPPGLLQKDEGTSHDREGVWTPRRGMTHANVTKKDNPITALVGLQTAHGDYVAVVAEGVRAYSEVSFDE
jgi:hypothetical protein